MPRPRSLRHYAPIGCAIGSSAALGTFVYLAIKGDQAGTAISAATLCLALAILAALDLESFEGLGIKAKLRSTLNDAEDRLRALDGMIVSLARSSFGLAANGTVELEDSMATVSHLTNSLKEMGFDTSKIDEIKSKFYGSIAWYHWNCLGHYYTGYVTNAMTTLNVSADGPNRLDEFNSGLKLWWQCRSARWPAYDTSHKDDQFKLLAEKVARELPFACDKDRNAFDVMINYAAKLVESCLLAGNYTEQSIYFLKYHRPIGGPDMDEAISRLSADALIEQMKPNQFY